MDLVPFGRGGCRCTTQYTGPGPNKYTPPGIVETHTAYRPRGSKANRGCGRFGGRTCPAAPPRIHNHDAFFSLARVMLAACAAVLHRTK